MPSPAPLQDPAGLLFSQEWGEVLSLDGIWELADSPAGEVPTAFPSRVPVPGLVSSAEPAFPDIGLPLPTRQAFWYRRSFTLPGPVPAVARLKIGKAMYGTQVFVNGHAVGSSDHSFVPLWFRVESYLFGDGRKNEIRIRVGAHISNLPDTVCSGGDAERVRYIPGVYDRVQLILSDAAFVSRVQVAPRPDLTGIDVAVETAGSTTHPLQLQARVLAWPAGVCVALAELPCVLQERGRAAAATAFIPLPGCQPWSPESPQLYVLELTDGRHRHATRFGLRRFRLDPDFTHRALLNEAPCFIRGTNIALHRFFEDAQCRQHPWDPAWVRQLIRKFTSIGMNGARLSLGPAPELWYEIADEEGFLIFDEYAIWYAYQPAVGDVSARAAHPQQKWGIWPQGLTAARLVEEFTAWMQERWNHACVIAWDAQNETWSPQIGEAIDAVRGLDLSDRPWDNGWSPPRARTDFREAHIYFESWTQGTEMVSDRAHGPKPFSLSKLSSAERLPSTFYRPYQSAYGLPADWHWEQPCLINEYAYLWLNRDGSPTELTRAYYDAVLGAEATPDQRRELYARYLAAVTEYWRAQRSCFGILYPFGLSGSIPLGATADNFVDIPSLARDRFFEAIVPDAFAPVGICAELWQEEYELRPWWGAQAQFPLAIINDTPEPLDGWAEVSILSGGAVVMHRRYRCLAAPYAVERRVIRIDLPETAGRYELVATLASPGGRSVSSRRLIRMVEKASAP